MQFRVMHYMVQGAFTMQFRVMHYQVQGVFTMQFRIMHSKVPGAFTTQLRVTHYMVQAFTMQVKVNTLQGSTSIYNAVQDHA